MPKIKTTTQPIQQIYNTASPSRRSTVTSQMRGGTQPAESTTASSSTSAASRVPSMKYPQLVSARAVNAISDWLVSRLEQLGVEAPQIYTRLLLSLLQSTVQINDPIEFSNLESFFANRKGGNKRYLSCDIDTLKKLNAIQCLRDIVSSEQEIVNIENLIEELCEKLKDIEKQTASNEDEDKLLVATLSLSHQHQERTPHPISNKYHSNYCSGFKEESTRPHKSCSSEEKLKADLESDPKKRYFRAFPALSKEMEDSFRIWRHNAKSLTWPVERNNMSISNSSSSSTISSSFGSGGNRGALVVGVGSGSLHFDKDTVDGENSSSKIDKDYIGTTVNEMKNPKLSQFSADGMVDGSDGFNISNMLNNGIRRKSKRRRGQGKSTQQIRKGTYGNIGGTTSQANNDSGVGTVRKYNRNSTPTYWDTDFEGCWEMGRDLIKEFIVRQNGKSRNRSTSESSAINRREVNAEANSNMVKNNNEPKKKHCNGEEDLKCIKMCSPLPPNVDISFCDDDYDDTLASISELTNDTSLNAMATAPAKRLYERELSDFGSHEVLTADTEEDEAAVNEQLNFAQFEAKFNSSVEALWKDTDSSVTVNVFGLSGASVQVPSALPTSTSLTQNLKNFWANYYNHHFDLHKILPAVNLPLKGNENCDTISYSCSLNQGLNMNEMTSTSDYFSMPNKLETINKQARVQRQNESESEERNTPVALFLQNSIWSENCNIGGGDTDESFYLKVQNSAMKLNTFDAEPENNSIGFSALNSRNVTQTNNNDAFPFPPYNISKWSEGINAGPNLQMQQSQLQKTTENLRHNSAADTKCTSLDLLSHATNPSQPSAASSFNWQAQLNDQSVHNGVQSWPSSHSLPLAEIFGADADNSTIMKGTSNSSSVNTHITDLNAPPITLVNHSAISSGFIEYSRVKSEMQLTKQENVKEQLNHPPQLQRSNEQYADDENLLTSERTHFHPIKSYADGHTFDICSELDVIQYKRSESGYLYWENEKYLEYTRSDNFIVEDEASTVGSGTGPSANPLYANSNCEAAIGRQQRNVSRSNKRNQMQDFVIKFRLQSTEIACQTEDDLEIVCENKHSAKLSQHPLYIIFSNAAKNMKQSSYDPICRDTVEAFNQAVSSTSHLSPNNYWLPATNNDDTLKSAYKKQSQSLVWNIPQRHRTSTNNKSDDDAERVVVDFYDADNVCGTDVDADMSSLEQQQWSMNEIRKKCQMAGHSSNYINNSNATSCGGEVESVWGMCAACNSELKSIPANRLLRDELKLEADEIMSDLKYMQDLYIGRADGDSETASDSDWTAEEENERNKSDGGILLDEELNVVDATEDLHHESCPSLQRAEGLVNRANLAIDNGEQMLRDAVIETVNRFITEWLCPENIEKNDKCKKDSSDTESSICDKRRHSSNLWHASKNEHSIWQLSEADGNNGNALKPLELLRHFSVKPVEDNMMHTNDENFLSELSWEHENLAKIWQNTPPRPTLNDSEAVTKGVSPRINCFPIPESKDNVTEIAGKNIKNLQNHVIGSANTPSFSFIGAISSSNTTPNINEGIQTVLNPLDTTIVPAEKYRIANRKRRHSASQNYFHNQSSLVTGALTNNNNADIADLNRYSVKSVSCLEPIIASATTSVADHENIYSNTIGLQNLLSASLRFSTAKKGTEYVSTIYSGDSTVYDSTQIGVKRGPDEGNKIVKELQKQRQNHTIITCKYHLTSIEPVSHGGGANNDLFTEGTALSCLIDKNSSILNHMTMVARPLTR